MMTILWIIKFSVVVHLVLRSIFVGETDFVYKNIFWEFHLASKVDYYDTIKKKMTTTTTETSFVTIAS